jgi:glycogen(starch) synthase
MNATTPLRVLMTTDTIGGVWTYALDLCGALAPHGVSVALATMGAPLSNAARASVNRLPNVELFESQGRLEWMPDAAEDVARVGEWLLKLEKTVRPDLIHLNEYADGALPFQAPVLVVGHSCVSSWWRAVRGGDPPAEWNAYWRAVAAGLRGADQVVAPSIAMLRALQEHYGMKGGLVIYHGRDPEHFSLQRKEPFVLAVGRLWDEAKNISTLADIAESLSWPTYIAGEERIADGGSAPLGGIHRLGVMSPAELGDWYGRASIYALPARYEPFGLSVLEAALSGCALVLGNIPSLREVWNEAAEYVPPNDSAALRGTIERLIDDGPRRAELGRLARQRAAEFTPARMAAEYLTVYRELVAVGAARCAS